MSDRRMQVRKRQESDSIHFMPSSGHIMLAMDTKDGSAITYFTLDEWYDFVAIGNQLAADLRNDAERIKKLAEEEKV